MSAYATNSFTRLRFELRSANKDRDTIEEELRLLADRPVPKYIGYLYMPGHGSEWDTFGTLGDASRALLTYANGPCVVPELCILDLYEIGDWEMIQSAKDMEDVGNPFDCIDIRYEVQLSSTGKPKVVNI